MDIKQIEYGVIGVLLANAPTLTDVFGTLTEQLDADSNVNSVKLTLATAPAALSSVHPKGGLWLTGNAGDYQRFEFKGISDNGDDTYTFALDKLTKVSNTILAGTDSFVENSDLPIFEYGDTVESNDFDFIQAKAEKPEQEFPGITGPAAEIWKITVMVAVVNRIKQDELRADLTDIYSKVEKAFVVDITKADLTTYSGVEILGLLAQESEDGKWDNERQGLIAGIEIKFRYV